MHVHECVCVSATVHTPARRGGCTGSDPGLTRGTATLIRVYVSAVHVACREHENEASVNVYEVLPSTFLRLRCTWWCVVNDLRLRCTCTCWCAVNAVCVWCVIRNERPGGAKRMDVIIGGPGVPELVLTASVCTPVRCLGCRLLNIGYEYTQHVSIHNKSSQVKSRKCGCLLFMYRLDLT